MPNVLHIAPAPIADNPRCDNHTENVDTAENRKGPAHFADKHVWLDFVEIHLGLLQVDLSRQYN